MNVPSRLRALRILAVTAGFSATLGSAFAFAQETEPPGRPRLIDRAYDRVSLRGGLLFTGHDTRARVDSKQLGPGTLVDVERELGLDDRTRDVRLDLSIRFGDRHQLQAGYVALTRRGQTSLERQIQWGDAVLAANVDVGTRVDLKLVPIAYRMSVLRSDRVDFGLSVGVFALFLDAEVVAPVVAVDERGSAEFPLPVIGADGIVALSPNLFFNGGARYFSLRVSGVDGVWREIRGALEYLPVRGVGLGLGYRLIRLEADGTEGIASRPEGSLLYLNYEFAGPHVYVKLSL